MPPKGSATRMKTMPTMIAHSAIQSFTMLFCSWTPQQCIIQQRLFSNRETTFGDNGNEVCNTELKLSAEMHGLFLVWMPVVSRCSLPLQPIRAKCDRQTDRETGRLPIRFPELQSCLFVHSIILSLLLARFKTLDNKMCLHSDCTENKELR